MCLRSEMKDDNVGVFFKRFHCSLNRVLVPEITAMNRYIIAKMADVS